MSKPAAQQPINGGHLPRMGRDYIRQVTRMRDDQYDDREPTLCEMIADEAAAFGVPEHDAPSIEMAVGFREPGDDDNLVCHAPPHPPPYRRREIAERARVQEFWDDDTLRQQVRESAALRERIKAIKAALATLKVEMYWDEAFKYGG